MNKRNLLRCASLSLLIVAIFLPGSCKDDGDENNGPGYRVVEWTASTEDVLEEEADITYEGNKVILISTVGYGSSGDSSRIEVEYPDANSAFYVEYYFTDGSWAESYKEELELQGEVVTQSVSYEYYEGTWEPSGKYIYQYAGDILELVVFYWYITGDWMPMMKEENEYEDGNLVLATTYFYNEGSWEVYYKNETVYSGDKKDYQISYMAAGGEFEETFKTEYNYSGDNLMSVDSYQYDNGTWVPQGVIMSFTYDSHGNVTSWYDPDARYRVNFTYEEGKGNIRQIMFGGADTFSGLAPLPTKSLQGRPGAMCIFLRKTVRKDPV